MKTGTLVMKLGAVLAPLTLMLALGAPAASAAGMTLVVAPILHPTDCGKYATSNYQDLSTALMSATSGTVVVCPGTYPAMSADAVISGASKLTVKRALTTDGSRPVIPVRPGTSTGLVVQNSSNVTIDGLILDGTGATSTSYEGIMFTDSSGAVRNSTVTGPSTGISSVGVTVLTTPTVTKALPVTISATNIFGFASYGILTTGLIKLTATSDVINSTDGGRLTAPTSTGIGLGGAVGAIPTGSVSKCVIVNSDTGIQLISINKFTVSGNHIQGASKGIRVSTPFFLAQGGSDGNKLMGNIITGVGNSSSGIYIDYSTASGYTSLNTLVSGNTIISNTYNDADYGVRFTADAPANTLFTAKVTKNTLIGFPLGNAILYPIFATVTVSGNNATP